jgi:malonate-semialdehyde dehydrogenase (acetylating)/methylmalonate-semialdehyde dehydrogenase
MAMLEEVAAHYGTVRNYVGGEWVESSSGELVEVMNPATDEPIAQVPMSSEQEVDQAVQEAGAAFPEWRETPPIERARYMFRLKEIMESNYERIARVVAQENGKIIDEARGEVRRAIENVEVAAGITSLMMGYTLEEGAAAGIDEEAIRQPLGVFAAICPFNFPAMVPFWFWPYAVACGNTFIVKPSELVPVTQAKIFELIEEVDLPPGVLNMINGGAETGRALVAHAGVSGVSFVGSTPVARAVYALAGERGKRAQCQGGAKNVLVVMPDADLGRAIPNLLSSCFGTAGQRCLAGAVVVAVGDVYEELREELVVAASRITLGYGLDESAQMGPVISKASHQRILGFIEQGVAAGARLLLDGRGRSVPGYEKGYFIGPTIFDNVTPEMSIAQEEIFGPVVCLMRAESLEESIALVNGSPFGNAASIYTREGRSAREFRYRAEVGNVGVNIGIAAPMAFFPFCGRKASFFGALHGQTRDCVDFFTDRKVVITRWF